jgi:dolichol-phosphate mannosyltransferase
MIEERRIAVVVPAKNEARHIDGVVRTMPAYVDHIIVIDDASRDDTAARAAQRGADVVRHATSRGVGGAIISGYRRAVELGADVIAVMAGDGQMDPADLRALLSPLLRGDADYVKGNRLRHPDVFRHMPWPRLLGTAVLGSLTALAIGIPLGDSQCGYTAISRHALQRIDLDALWPRYGYPNDLLAMLAREQLRVREVTVRPVYRDEQSGLRVYHVGTIAWLIGRAGWRRVRS